MLDVRRLRLLRELAQRGTLAAVADALGYSPSLVSHQLARLEREAGTALLEKVGRRVRLTPAGQSLVGHADVVLNELDRAEADLAAHADGAAGRVLIALFSSAAHTLLVPMLASLASSAPGLEVEARVLEPELSLPQLASHDVDLVVYEEYPGLPLPRLPRQHRERLGSDPLRLATASAKTVAVSPYGERLDELSDEAWVLEPAGTTARVWAEAACRQAGFEPRVRFESIDLMLHRRLVAEGLAVGFLPDLAGAHDDQRIQLHALPGEPRRLIGTAVRTGHQRHPHVVAVRAALASAELPGPDHDLG